MRKFIIKYFVLDYVILSRRKKGKISTYPRLSLPISLMVIPVVQFVLHDEDYPHFSGDDWVYVGIFLLMLFLPWILKKIKFKPRWDELSSMQKLSLGLKSDEVLSKDQNEEFWQIYKDGIKERSSQIIPFYINIACVLYCIWTFIKEGF